METDFQNSRQENTVVPKLIHVTERGFTIIHDGGSRPDFDIVFIHGIQGHPLRTWTHDLTQTDAPKSRRFLGLGKSRSGTLSRDRSRSGQGRHQDFHAGFWPAHLLKKDFPNARILTYGYDSKVSNFFGGGANQNDIVTIANGFLNDLAAQRVGGRGRDMMIVSHSMGGLITKEVPLERAATTPVRC
ncbi:hypothetical protein LTS07_007842 [Exophiala sideris]|uniref:GPI inositol-deacylase n=1 Tax=Exophiala sideris TaxID=1016849 RepID=A0ABR0JG61_9EURO|nr:hypothetical protein LTS07_007842 [Exophiala sideris]KAK5033152.1 hypothetical protein LTR13_007117 [Exophiala sideris]KAK5063637.1 hypothetical protein LTR69_004343 [Exophiala sideris]KAK5180529.1 hypothetical protein LTR44_006843 [Eurotiomycetes sp. CCFEE 6388]